jgi:hypothetical protein
MARRAVVAGAVVVGLAVAYDSVAQRSPDC